MWTWKLKQEEKGIVEDLQTLTGFRKQVVDLGGGVFSEWVNLGVLVCLDEMDLGNKLRIDDAIDFDFKFYFASETVRERERERGEWVERKRAERKG